MVTGDPIPCPTCGSYYRCNCPYHPPKEFTEFIDADYFSDLRYERLETALPKVFNRLMAKLKDIEAKIDAMRDR
jgi:hypothetical protein